MIKFKNVSFRYPTGSDILRNLSFDLVPGSFHFLTGGSGAGKSSLLKLIYLAALPTAGTISLFNKNVSQFRREDLYKTRRRIGVVFQDFRLMDHLTALENVALPLKVAGAKRHKVEEHVSELLKWVGLGKKLNDYPASLSGGEKQRLAIARAVIAKPQLLVADEPTGNVDDKIALRLMYLFEELHRMGTTVVIATHNTSIVEKFAHPVLHLEDGELNLIDR